MNNGHFITFEGGEGSGKSTQIALLSAAFTRCGLAHVATREPGGTKGAEAIRSLIVQGGKDEEGWSPLSDCLLFLAARVDHVEKNIRPALALGKHVICDRYSDSTYVYQGVAGTVDARLIQSLHLLTLGDVQPQLTLILDIAPEVGLKRAAARHSGGETRFEEKALSFHHAVREGFLALSSREPQRCVVIDARQPLPEVHAQIIAAVNLRLGLSLEAAAP